MCIRDRAYGIRRENGSRVSCFVYKSHTIQGGKPELPGLPAVYVEQDEEAQTLELYLEDPVAGMELVLLYTIYENMPVLTRSARFICRGPEPVLSLIHIFLGSGSHLRGVYCHIGQLCHKQVPFPV